MKKILYCFIGIFLAYLPHAYAQLPCEYDYSNGTPVASCLSDEYVLVWHDEFDGNALNFDKWYVGANPDSQSPPNPPADRTIWQSCKREHQIYLESNVTVSGGMAHLTVRKEDYLYEGITPNGINCDDGNTIFYEPGDNFSELFHFTSGRINGRTGYQTDKHLFMEMRCKIPKGKGLWPAFWVWNQEEIDVFEFFNTEDDDHFQTAYIKDYDNICDYDVCGSNFTEDFHTYSVEITPFFIKWFLDGNLVRSVPKYYNAIGTPNGTVYQPLLNACNPINPNLRDKNFPEDGRWFSPLINVAVNPKYNVNEISGFPGTMDVDYARVYRRLPKEDETNICPYGIGGENRICDDEVVDFSVLGNIPSSSNIIWSTSSNLTIVEEDYDNIAVKQNENSTQNNGWVKAEFPEIEEYCSGFTHYVKTNNSPIKFDIIEDRPTCLIDAGYYRISPRTTNVNWSVTGNSISLTPSSGAYTYVETFVEGEFFLTATIVDVCGDIITRTERFYAGREQCDPKDPKDPRIILRLSPNPSSDILNLEVDDSFSDMGDFKIVIINHNSDIMFQQVTSDSNPQIDVSGYENGLYYLRVLKGEKQETTPFIVSHE